MTIDELCLEIAKRLNDDYQIKYSTPFVKATLLKSMDVVLSMGKMNRNDYSGLEKKASFNGASFDFEKPIRQIKTVIGDDYKNTYYPKTIEEVANIKQELHLLPKNTEAFFYLAGNTLNLIPSLGDTNNLDTSVTVWFVGNPSDTGTADIKTIYSDYFLEVSVQETIKRIMVESDIRE
jgi:hypothetical protein